MRKKKIISAYLFLILFSFASIIIKTYVCGKIKLEIVDSDKKSIEGKIKNNVKQFSQKKLLVITNITNLEVTHKSFLSLLSGKEGNYVKKVVHIDKGSTSDRNGKALDGGDGKTVGCVNGKTKNGERELFGKIDHSLYDGLVIILDTLDDDIITKLNIDYVKSFIEKKKHIFLSLNRVNGKIASAFLNELNLNVHGNNSYVYDNFNSILLKRGYFDGKEKVGKAFYSTEIIENTPIIVSILKKRKQCILFKGTAHSVLLKNKYYLNVLTCPKTCVLYDKNDNIMKKRKQGTDLLLVSSIQLENNFRLIFSSSSDIFSDLFFSLNKDNYKFADNLIQWNLKMTGILRYNNFKLYKKGDKEKKDFFVDDYVLISIDLYELNNSYWIPYKENDIQFELIKMEIITRKFFYTNKYINSPTYYKYINLPKEHGVYKLHIYYLRKGYNILNLEYFIPVRSFLHYDKSKKVKLKNYPFYFYIYLSLLCFFIITLIILFDDSRCTSEEAKKEKMA
ncbi:dolichyl-diphosphooligosaccharide--protein glycosyltransferase, putative [Plasmodium malariae]|uniref:Dolichyl-diphosphooligosaccharide--protein glycosyltransferase 48 kDa subunit n=1 Tax=Plasmodium malariae TaxID=5858 RepID=A0A1C3KBM2_PLAMA|nr:dolichyl-diphosphooligosaccharide--protein glycosyltransferase, putative [Plasmodium malariae]